MKFKLFSLLIFMSITLASNVNQNRSLTGKVLEIETGKPVENALVFLNILDEKFTSMTTTDKDGNYSFPEITGKVVSLEVTRIGYDGAVYGPFNLKVTKLKRVNFDLTPILHQTEVVEIIESHDPPKLVKCGFYRRLDSRNGRFLTYKDLEKKHVNTFSHLFDHIPGYRFNAEEGKVVSLRQRGMKFGYTPVYVDGILVDSDIDLGNYIQVDNIEGIEIYRGVGSVPVQYSPFGAGNGAVLIWTK